MTTLSTTTSANHRFHPAEYMHYGYLANGWNKPLRWSGITATTESVGIVGPSTDLNSWQPAMVLGSTGTGDMSAGIHYFRYRYKDTTTGYVSNPSEERTFPAGTVSSGQYSVTFPISTSGVTNIIRSTDSKVDRVVLEMTVAGGTEFFSAAEVLNTASSIVLEWGVTDAAIGVSFLPYPEFGHELPPITKYLVSHRRRFFAFGQVKHSTGTAKFLNTNVDVTKGTTDPDWNDEVLGSATAKSVVKWYIRRVGGTSEYEIDYYDAGNNKIVLTGGFGEASTPLASNGEEYTIYSKANTIWVSNPGYPEGYSTLEFLDSPQGEMSGRLTAGVGYGNSMVFFTENTMFKLAWDSGPLIDPFMINLSLKAGAISQRTVVEVDGRIFSMDRNGWHIWSNGLPKIVSRPIDDLLDLIDFTYMENFHACYFPALRAIRWFVCYTGDVYPKNYIQLDIDSGAWGTGEYKQGISESRLVLEKYGRVRTLLGDENGHVWLGDFGTGDGASPTFSHLVAGGLPASPDPTTTVVYTTVTLPEASSGLTGCFVYWVEGAEYRLITSNDFSSFTVGTAFGSAPAVGATFWVGVIPSKLKTKAFSASKLAKVKRTKYLTLGFQPTTRAGELNVRVYEDYSAVKKQWRAGGNDLDGVTWPTVAGNDWKVDTSFADGVVDIPIGSEFRRVFEVELELIEPDVPLELFSIEHEGDEVGDMT